MNKEELEVIVHNSNSLTDVLRKMNKSISGTSIRLLKELLSEYGIQYNFLNFNTGGNYKEIPLLDILKENRPYKSQSLKNRLILNGIKENKCECCGLQNIWNGKEIVLQLHHINGNHADNRLENLLILCPNCHSLTTNFKNKHNKIVNRCLDCGKEILKTSKYCCKCSSKHRKTQIFKPTKEELLMLIQKKSFVEIGNKYNVSESCIRKWCVKYNLPSSKHELRSAAIV